MPTRAGWHVAINPNCCHLPSISHSRAALLIKSQYGADFLHLALRARRCALASFLTPQLVHRDFVTTKQVNCDKPT